MEFVILGLLSLRVRTIYDIKKALEETLSLFYSASFGSINSAIKRMLEKDWISVEETVENGRFKKIYSITSAGETAFQDWLGSEIEQIKVKEPALTRLFFMGFLDAELRTDVIQEHLNSLQEMHAYLSTLYIDYENTSYPEDKLELVSFQLRALQYGRDYYAFSIAWYQKLLTEIQETNR